MPIVYADIKLYILLLAVFTDEISGIFESLTYFRADFTNLFRLQHPSKYYYPFNSSLAMQLLAIFSRDQSIISPSSLFPISSQNIRFTRNSSSVNITIADSIRKLTTAV